jgi:hypothetical protein
MASQERHTGKVFASARTTLFTLKHILWREIAEKRGKCHRDYIQIMEWKTPDCDGGGALEAAFDLEVRSLRGDENFPIALCGKRRQTNHQANRIMYGLG